MSNFIVTTAAARPAGPPDECFYCYQKVGTPHKSECVLVCKKIKIRMIVEYEAERPASWDKHQIEFHYNDSSWCAGNALQELKTYTEKANNTCLCNEAHFEYVEDVSEPYLSEG